MLWEAGVGGVGNAAAAASSTNSSTNCCQLTTDRLELPTHQLVQDKLIKIKISSEGLVMVFLFDYKITDNIF